MSGPNGHQHAGQTRFKIASQLGGFRNTITLPDPFNTGASFTIHRNGSNAHRAWFKEQFDKNKLSLVMAEAMLADEPVVLTDEEGRLVAAARTAADSAAPPVRDHLTDVLSVVDRLVDSTANGRGRNAALRQALRTGRLTPSEVAHHGFNDQLEEALFTLKSWEGMPGEDEDGNPIMIPYSLDAARDLLMNDTPLEDCGLDELILSVDAWRIEGIPSTALDPIPSEPVYIMIPGLKLGRAYQLWILRRSHDSALFRTRTLEAAAKNSPASSETISSSGDATDANEKDSESAETKVSVPVTI